MDHVPFIVQFYYIKTYIYANFGAIAAFYYKRRSIHIFSFFKKDKLFATKMRKDPY